jgi:1-aminocyclopropane-1-carboxylate deaminase/D-cysteine desulfhydrase-like pyridoxal-dependent ACC family enzyme
MHDPRAAEDPYPVSVPEPPTDLALTPTRLDTLALPETEGNDTTAFVKRDDRTGGPTQGNKLRKLEYMLGDAREAGADVLVTGGGVQSNHCRATAVVADAIVAAGRDAGLVLDPTYTGKAFRAFREHVADARSGRHLFVHTGGSYGLFPERDAIGAALDRAGE